jgi:hypothetical protein
LPQANTRCPRQTKNCRNYPRCKSRTTHGLRFPVLDKQRSGLAPGRTNPYFPVPCQWH